MKKFRGRMCMCRSKWELHFARYLDYHPNVIEWAFERTRIRYFDPVTRKLRHYIIDFDVNFKDGRKYLIEIKPRKETRPPRKDKRKSEKTKIYEVKTWATNQAKWEAAQKVCNTLGKEFKVLTEKDLF